VSKAGKDDGAPTIAANSDVGLQLQQAKEAAATERKAAEAAKAEQTRVMAAELPDDAADDVIDAHYRARNVATGRVELAERRLAKAEARAAELEEQAADEQCRANFDRAVADQAEAVVAFRELYPPAMETLFKLLFEAHRAESEIWALKKKNLPSDIEPPPSVFMFHGQGPAHLRLQVVDRRGKVLWQGDEHNDVMSQEVPV
jgi:hypothetical protein